MIRQQGKPHAHSYKQPKANSKQPHQPQQLRQSQTHKQWDHHPPQRSHPTVTFDLHADEMEVVHSSSMMQHSCSSPQHSNTHKLLHKKESRIPVRRKAPAPSNRTQTQQTRPLKSPTHQHHGNHHIETHNHHSIRPPSPPVPTLAKKLKQEKVPLPSSLPPGRDNAFGTSSEEAWHNPPIPGRDRKIRYAATAGEDVASLPPIVSSPQPQPLHRPTQSPPVPALRKKMKTEKTALTHNTQNTAPDSTNTSEKAIPPPPLSTHLPPIVTTVNQTQTLTQGIVFQELSKLRKVSKFYIAVSQGLNGNAFSVHRVSSHIATP